MPTIFNVRCPSCGRDADSHIDVYSGLGPALLQCPACAAVFPGNRKEWAQLGVWGRLWFVLYSLAGIAVGSAAVGFTSGFAFTAARTGETSVREAPPFIVVPTIAFWAVLLTALQAYRLVSSVRRVGPDGPRPYRAAFWSLQLGMQTRLLGWGALWIGLCALLGLAFRG
jgi:hypothetical protein